ncbi:MAG: PH domain-containing protein [Streptosporangiaceae bacterium]
MRLTRPARRVPAAASRYLLPNEKSIITLLQHPAKLLPPLTVAMGGLLAAVAVSAIFADVRSAHYVVWALAAFLILRLVLDVLSWRVQYIVLTSRRLILTSGLSGRRVTVIPLVALRDLSFVRSTGGRVLGYGAFTFEAGSQSTTVIDYIPYPEQIYLEIYGLLFAGDKDGTGESGADAGAAED